MPRKDYTSVQNVTLPADPASTLERLFPPVGESSMLMVACRRGDYSASRIARAGGDGEAPQHEAVARSLERYGYEVIDTAETIPSDESLMQSRYDELMRYLGL